MAEKAAEPAPIPDEDVPVVDPTKLPANQGKSLEELLVKLFWINTWLTFASFMLGILVLLITHQVSVIIFGVLTIQGINIIIIGAGTKLVKNMMSAIYKKQQ